MIPDGHFVPLLSLTQLLLKQSLKVPASKLLKKMVFTMSIVVGVKVLHLQVKAAPAEVVLNRGGQMY